VKRQVVRLFKHDLMRKILALILALVLFDVLDRKVQADDRLTVHVVYVDEPELDRVPDAPDRTSELVVAERGRGAKPLVISSRPRPDRITFRLHATKDAIERAKSHRYTFVLRLLKEGQLEPTAGDLEGIDRLLDELGAGARVEVDRVQWVVEPEETAAIELDRDDVVVRGSPAPGFDLRLRSTLFKPSSVRLVGPRSAVQKALRVRARLFDEIELDGRASETTQALGLRPEWRDALELRDAGGEALAAVRATVRFERKMIPVPPPEGLFELPVHVVCNDDVLRQRDAQKSWRDGWRLEFQKASGGELRLALQIVAPDAFVSAPVLDRAKLTIAKDSIELLVRAQEAAGVPERTTLPVSIQKLADFPPDLDVVFADGSPRADVEVIWIKPAAPGGEAKEKSGGNGGG